jgi:hypothetical protein
MAFQAGEGGHFRRILVGIMTVTAIILFNSRVQIGLISLVGVAISARPVPLIL